MCVIDLHTKVTIKSAQGESYLLGIFSLILFNHLFVFRIQSLHNNIVVTDVGKDIFTCLIITTINIYN